MNGLSLGKWKKPAEAKVRQLAEALGIAGARTRPIDDVRKAVNNTLLGTWRK